MGVPQRDLTGRKYTRLTVVRYNARWKLWLCRCDCGNYSLVQTRNLNSGHSRSCGCLRHDLLVEYYSKLNLVHGLHKTLAHANWSAMMQRCFDENAGNYPEYGGRGITVCERWLKFENFFEDMGDRPTPEHSLDRYPNRDGNYEPGNVRWATKSEQRRNQDRCRSVDAV
jgi:hypothetical protein